MICDHRANLSAALSRINRQIAKAEKLTVAKGDDDTLHRTSKVLSDMRVMKRDVQAELRGK